MKLATPSSAALLLLAAALAATLSAGCSDAPGATSNTAPAPAPVPVSGVVLRLATTTSVNDSGLLGALLPVFEKETGIRVTVTAVGTGAAFKLARDGNADALLVHDKKGEEEFIATGDGTERVEFMWNTFEILGPAADPAKIATATSGAAAMKLIAEAGAPFVSRGDDSGTHRREKSLLAKAGVEKPSWSAYRSTGQGMGLTLTVANETGAYVLCDQGTRLGWRGELRLTPLVANLDDLKNRYAFVRIAKAKHPTSDVANADRLIAWFLSPETTRRIEAFQVGGRPLFIPTGAGR